MSASFTGLGELLHRAEWPIPWFGDGDWRLGLQNRSRPGALCQSLSLRFPVSGALQKGSLRAQGLEFTVALAH